MHDQSRRHWNERYRGGAGSDEPSPFLVGLGGRLPTSGRAVDIAGGRGRHAIWLARRGLDVTLVDVSDVALDLARTAANESEVAIHTVRADLTRDPLPPGPWDLAVVFHYLERSLFPSIEMALAPGGILVAVIATVRNLERHERPPRRFLLEEGEAASLVRTLVIESCDEGWLDEGRHEARLVAIKPA